VVENSKQTRVSVELIIAIFQQQQQQRVRTLVRRNFRRVEKEKEKQYFAAGIVGAVVASPVKERTSVDHKNLNGAVDMLPHQVIFFCLSLLSGEKEAFLCGGRRHGEEATCICVEKAADNRQHAV
jgi:hypothetical protein